MSREWTRWPGMSGAPERDQYLEIRRAAFGKAEGAPTDFRWLAATDDWFPSQERLPYTLKLGRENRCDVYCPLWRHEEGSVLAVMCRPSRTKDIGGRATPIEKHLIQWVPDPGVPPAMAAFTLLDTVSGYDDSLWSGSYTDAAWHSRDYYYQLPRQQPLQISGSAMDGLVASGIQDLRAATTLEALSDFYSLLLARPRRLALLKLTVPTPLRQRALAAILLPMPAGPISLAGGIPSFSFPGDEDSSHWTGLAVQTDVSGSPAVRSLGTSDLERGRRLATALWEKTPSLIDVGQRPFVSAPAMAPAESRGVQDSASPPEPATASLPTVPAETSVVSSPAPLDIKALFGTKVTKAAFKRFLDGERRFIDPGSLLPNELTPTHDVEEGRHMAEQFRRVMLEGQLSRSDSAVAESPTDLARAFAEARRQQLQVKADICRAWLMAIAPHEEVLEIAGPLQTAKIEPLFVAVHVKKREDWAACCRLTPETVQSLIDMSLERASSDEMRQRIVRWGLDVNTLLGGRLTPTRHASD